MSFAGSIIINHSRHPLSKFDLDPVSNINFQTNRATYNKVRMVHRMYCRVTVYIFFFFFGGGGGQGPMPL